MELFETIRQGIVTKIIYKGEILEGTMWTSDKKAKEYCELLNKIPESIFREIAVNICRYGVK